MSYHYSDPAREHETHALPNVHVWADVVVECLDCGCSQPRENEACVECDADGDRLLLEDSGPPPPEQFWYAFGFPGCLYDSDAMGPFRSEEAALKAARELCDD